MYTNNTIKFSKCSIKAHTP